MDIRLCNYGLRLALTPPFRLEWRGKSNVLREWINYSLSARLLTLTCVYVLVRHYHGNRAA